ncbi:MAG: RagB/SusD family nutrient uptake outer membrane protein [Lunatimonas sp.]|uniref:RagB/SusD family nutrient uptake outer membrane protein n=1 Tax=Lunatimonas sp. TaxID=2060141 RepID=UPI00263B7114|nr:RagB/SusD family nutrient uptake outer membrane protein [Lunatimonas sp.]MCC5939474.1 RagB/SusD family nutrient uptake outer membrane protein [Lunatimonas sp.]
MKRFIIIIWLVVLSSCSDGFLEIYPETTLNEGNFYKSQEEFILLANGCYVPMRDYEKDLHWVLAELISDNTSFQYNIRTGEAVRGVIDQFIITADNRGYASFWNLSYNGVTRCNKLLNEIDRPGVTWQNIAYKDRSAGEAYFLRALYYFNLVRQFGGVPLVLAPITAQEAVNIGRSTEQEVYGSIISDLNQAISHFTSATGVKENGRANEHAARALLGKVHLTIGNDNEAATNLKAVIDANAYSLLPNYADLFNPSVPDFKETLFAIQYSENNRELSNRFIFMFAPWSSAGQITNRPNINMISAGWNMPTKDLIDAFEEGDLRKSTSIKMWTGEDWDGEIREIAYCGKYKPPVSAPDDRCGDNLPIIRYSDVLLMYAEALNNLGRTVEATGFVRMVRERAGLMNPIDGLNAGELAALIAKERQVEFCFENQRWYDLKRTGTAVETMREHGIREKAQKPFLFATSFNITPNKLLAPIPAEQILINRIAQNPGY